MSERKASEVFVECLEAEGRQVRVRHSGRGNARPERVAGRSTVSVHPRSPRAGRGVHGRRVRAAHRPGGRLSGDARARSDEPGHSGGRRIPGSRSSRRSDRSVRPRAHAQGIAPVHRPHRIMRPITKWNARVSSPEIIPEVVRKAFEVAESEKPGSTHLELPEDVMRQPLDAAPLPRHAPVQPEPGGKELQRAADMIDARLQSARARRQRRDSRPRRPRAAGVRPQRPGSPSPRRSWPRAWSTTRTRTRSARSGCRPATTRWPASTMPIS